MSPQNIELITSWKRGPTILVDGRHYKWTRRRYDYPNHGIGQGATRLICDPYAETAGAG